ncbi:MAG: ATP-grasp domain-containing protein [Rhizomicrobium sp.]
MARLASGFAQAGMAVEALAPPGATVIASRYLDRWHRYRALRPLSSLASAIAAAAPDLLVCCDDRTVMHVLTLHRRTRAQGKSGAAIMKLIERSLGHPRVYRRMISRDGFLAEARAEGIRTPDTMCLVTEHDLKQALAELGVPLVLKVDGSWGGEGVVIARNRTDALAAFRKLSGPPSRVRSVARALKRHDAHFLRDAVACEKRRVSAQRFVAGHCAASAIACWQGEVIAEIDYDVLVADGTIGPPNVIRRVDCPELREASRKIAKHFGLSGIHGMDFIRDEAGHVHLIEINPRATQGSTLAFGRGADLPAALAACFLPDAACRPAIAGELVALFPRVWLRDPLSPYLASAHHDVPWDDPQVLFATLGIKSHQLRGAHLPSFASAPTVPGLTPPRAFARLMAKVR